jgi:large subunit ribosomal protein L25
MPDGKQLVLIKDIQRDPVRQIIEHLDLVIVRKGEKVTVDIAVHVEGEPFPGTMVQIEHSSISVEAEATHIPESVTVSVEGLEEGAQIHAGDLVLPGGSTLVSAPEMLVLIIQLPPKVEDVAPVADSVEAAAPADASANSGGDDAGGE